MLVNSNLSGWDPTESADGRFIYFTSKGANLGLWRTTVKGEEPRHVLDDSIASTIQCAFEDDGIYFVAPRSDNGYSIRFYELATGKTKTVAELGKQPCWTLTVSPDRRWALYTQTDEWGSDLMLVENFQ